MSMGSAPEDFDSLQKLLRLKRYEQPPPRYFNEFSGRVLARIEAGEARASWWERLGFDLRPAMAAVAGVFACGLVVYGVATADGGLDDPHALAFGQPGAGYGASALSDFIAANSENSLAANSTNPVSYGTPIDRRVFGGANVLSAGYGLR
jgi:hypothetical protein